MVQSWINIISTSWGISRRHVCLVFVMSDCFFTIITASWGRRVLVSTRVIWSQCRRFACHVCFFNDSEHAASWHRASLQAMWLLSMYFLPAMFSKWRVNYVRRWLPWMQRLAEYKSTNQDVIDYDTLLDIISRHIVVITAKRLLSKFIIFNLFHCWFKGNNLLRIIK